MRAEFMSLALHLLASIALLTPSLQMISAMYNSIILSHFISISCKFVKAHASAPYICTDLMQVSYSTLLMTFNEMPQFHQQPCGLLARPWNLTLRECSLYCIFYRTWHMIQFLGGCKLHPLAVFRNQMVAKKLTYRTLQKIYSETTNTMFLRSRVMFWDIRIQLWNFLTIQNHPND